MDKKSKYFFAFLLVLCFATLVATFFRFIVIKDFESYTDSYDEVILE